MQSQSDNIKLQVYPHQVSGKEPKLLSHDGTKIYKGYNPQELHFYQTVFNSEKDSDLKKLKALVPQYYGRLELKQEPQLEVQKGAESDQKQWLNHLASRYKKRNESNSFIIMQNLTYNFKKPCVFDIKIGGRNIDGKKHKHVKPVSNLFIKLNGCRLLNVCGKDLLFSKYFLANIIEQKDIAQYLAFFLAIGDTIQNQILTIVIPKLKQILAAFTTIKGYRFISTSLCFIYDQEDLSKTDVRVIDFGRLIDQENIQFHDEESEKGVANIIKLMEQIAENREKYAEAVPKVRQHCLESQIMHIPEEKRSKPTSSTSV